MSSTQWEKAFVGAFRGVDSPAAQMWGEVISSVGVKQSGVLEWDEEKLQCATGRKAPWWQGEGGGGRIVCFRKFCLERSALENDLV